MARKIAVATAATPRGWLDSVRPLIAAHVGDESLLERRYHELITAASRLFEQKGFDRTTIEEIATQLDLSVGAIYRYVERKEDILLLTLARTLWLFQAQVGEATADVHDAEEKLRRAIRIYFQNIGAYAPSALLAYREGYVLTGDARRLLKDLERETNRIFEAIIAEGIHRGVFRRCRVDVATYNIVMLAHMWALKRWYLGKVLSLDAYIDEQTEFVLLALRPRAPARAGGDGVIEMTDTATNATLEAAIKAIGLGAGARVVGIAAAAAFREKVPEGYRPEDILPGAQSVVVAGGDGPTAGAWRSPDHRVMEITGYDLRENVAIHAMCDHIESRLGHYAIQAPSLPMHGHEPPMSMMHAAELAGLGSRSLAAHIILNPEYGLLYYAALITTLPLTPDPPLDKPACLNAGCAAMYKRIGTTPCLRVCPACLKGTVKDGAIETSTYDREKCHSRAQTYGIGSFQKGLLAIVNEEDADRRHTMIYGDFFTKTLLSVGFFRDSIAQCFECMRVCPVGRKHRKLQ